MCVCVCVVAEQSVAATNSNSVVPTVASRPRAAPDTPILPRGSSRVLWSVDANVYDRFEEKRGLILVTFYSCVTNFIAYMKVKTVR